MADVIVLDSDEDATPPTRSLWRPRYVMEKKARMKAETQAARLQATNDKLRQEAAGTQAELESTKADVRSLQSATDVLDTELAQSTASARELAQKLQAEQAEVARLKAAHDIAMAENERLGQELAIATGAYAQLQKERAVRMEALAQVTEVARGLCATAALAQVCLDAAREERQQTPLHQKLGQHRSSLIPGCEFISPPASPREKGTAEGGNVPAAAKNRPRSSIAISAPGASAFKLDGPGGAVATTQSSKAATSEALYFDTRYVFQKGKPGKGTDGELQSSALEASDDFTLRPKICTVLCPVHCKALTFLGTVSVRLSVQQLAVRRCACRQPDHCCRL